MRRSLTSECHRQHAGEIGESTVTRRTSLVVAEPGGAVPLALPVCKFPNRIVVVQKAKELREEVLPRVLRQVKNLRASGATLDEVVMVCVSADSERYLVRASLGTALLDLLAAQEGLLRIIAGTPDQHLCHQLFLLAGYWTEGTVARSRLRLEFPPPVPSEWGGLDGSKVFGGSCQPRHLRNEGLLDRS
jgi:hypothetical protein